MVQGQQETILNTKTFIHKITDHQASTLVRNDKKVIMVINEQLRVLIKNYFLTGTK